MPVPQTGCFLLFPGNREDYRTVSTLMVLVLPGAPLICPPVSTTLSPGCRRNRSFASFRSCQNMTSMEENASVSTGVTPQDRFSFRHALGLVVVPMIFTGQRKRLTIRAVRPESELTTMAFAPTSTAMEQVAWEMASRLLWIRNSMVWNRSA